MSRHTPDQQDDMNYISPEDALILELRPQFWPGTRRVKIHVTLTPHTQPLNMEAVIFDSLGNKVSEIDIIGTPDEKFVFTMHLPEEGEARQYRLQARLYSEEIPDYDHKELNFEIV